VYVRAPDSVTPFRRHSRASDEGPGPDLRDPIDFLKNPEPVRDSAGKIRRGCSWSIARDRWKTLGLAKPVRRGVGRGFPSSPDRPFGLPVEMVRGVGGGARSADLSPRRRTKAADPIVFIRRKL